MKIGTFLRLEYQTQLSLPLAPPGAGLQVVRAIPDPRTIESLRGELQRRLAIPVRIQVHDNRSTMVSYKRDEEGFTLRLHRMFLPPAPELAERLAQFAVGRGRPRAEAGRWIDRYIREHQNHIRRPQPPPVPPSRGQNRDLKPIFDSLNRRYFAGEIEAEIGWSRAPAHRRRRSIKMGVYLHDHRHIRIHPALDRPEIPDYLVEFVVYHEMCHQVCPPEPGPSGKKRIHTRAFRERERQHPERERALSWEKKHLDLLLRPVRTSAPPVGRDREDYP